MLFEEKEFRCQCGRPLNVSAEVAEDLKKDEDAVLWCEFCGYAAEIEHGKIVEYIPPRAATRWTGGGPALESCP